jgi:RHH-type transcriptional regulator, rel operon repressor / antitoxin RelB
VLAIRLPENIEKRLDHLARRSGRTKTYQRVRRALHHLEGLADIYLAEKRLEAVRAGRSRTAPGEKEIRTLWPQHRTGRLRSGLLRRENARSRISLQPAAFKFLYSRVGKHDKIGERLQGPLRVNLGNIESATPASSAGSETTGSWSGFYASATAGKSTRARR